MILRIFPVFPIENRFSDGKENRVKIRQNIANFYITNLFKQCEQKIVNKFVDIFSDKNVQFHQKI